MSLHRSTAGSNSIPTTTQLAVKLQFMATGTFQTVIATAHGISQPSVSRCIAANRCAFQGGQRLYTISKPGKTNPTTRNLLQKSEFPLVLRCIDGTQVPIIAPSVNEEIYVNHKNTHSRNIQAISDSVNKFIDVVAKCPESTHHAFIWRMYGVNQRTSSGNTPNVNGR